ncbi:MAG: hypothetical protein KatS3mg110_2841 [Pirellulaceae bacterium]|nr:MAG: hypothetical protein KatS3mg110_2841 [Pirellulaceae bacterium]
MQENVNPLFQAIQSLLVDATGSSGWAIKPDSSLMAFLPELTLCATIVALLVVRLFRWGDRLDNALARRTGTSLAFVLALAGSLLALIWTAPWRHLSGVLPVDDPASAARMEIFTGMLVYDTFTVFMRSILLLFAVLFVLFTRLTQVPNRVDATDIYTLVLGATLGMCLMASANHLLMVFLAVEMASVPSYVLAGMLRGNRFSSEAALKYSVYGAGTAGVMLYGISLIAGVTGTVHLPSIAQKLAELDVAQLAQTGRGELLALVFGGLMLAVGLAFKLSAVPFHFWCPDVFEGAAAEVGAFLSVASKAAALALLVRVVIGVSAIVPVDPGEKAMRPGERTARATPNSEQVAWYRVVDEVARQTPPAHAVSHVPGPTPLSQEQANQRLEPVRRFVAKFVALLAVITCTFGNLAAYGQTNIKRLLAYSTIAHAGYMMMGVPAAVALAGVSSQGAESAVAGVALYMFVYLFMNLGAFAVVAFLRNAMHSEEIADYAGLIRRLPVTVVCLSIMLFSLIGLPPLAGFIGKFAVFAGLAQAYTSTGAFYLVVVLVIGALNTFLSLFYYVRVIKCMTFDPEPDTRGPVRLPILCSTFIVVLTVPLVALIFGWADVWNASLEAARFLF